MAAREKKVERMPGGEARRGGSKKRRERCGDDPIELMTTTTCGRKRERKPGTLSKKLKHPFRGAEFFRGGVQLPLGRSCSCSGQPGCGKRWGGPSLLKVQLSLGGLEVWLRLADLARYMFIFKTQKAVLISHSPHVYLILQASRGRAPKISDHHFLASPTRPAVGICPFDAGCRLPRWRTSTTSTRGRVELSWMQTCPHSPLLAPRSSPCCQSSWLCPSARVPTPDRANGTYVSPLEVGRLQWFTG